MVFRVASKALKGFFNSSFFYHPPWPHARSLNHSTKSFFSSNNSLVPLCYSAPSQKTLPNGLRIVTLQHHHPMVCVSVFVNYGSRDETAQTNGVAHFLEHMMFKGTRRRSRIALEKEIEDMGAQLNAYTSREQTVYSSRAFKKNSDQVIDILADILTHSNLDPRAIEEEKYVICREMEEVEKIPEEVIFDQLHSACYNNHPLHFPILGPIQNITQMQRSTLAEAIENHYTSDQIVVVGIGDLNPEVFSATVEESFRSLPVLSQPKMLPKCTPAPRFIPCYINQRSSDIDDVHAVVAVESVGWKDPMQPMFLLLQSLFRHYDSSNYLSISPHLSSISSIRALAPCLKQESTFVFNSFTTYYKDTGLFGFYVSGAQETIDTATNLLLTCLTSLSHQVTEKEFNMAKRNLKYNLLESVEMPMSLCDEIGRQTLIFGQYTPLVQLLDRVDRIMLEEFRLFLSNYLDLKRLAIVTRSRSGNPLPYLERRLNI